MHLLAAPALLAQAGMATHDSDVFGYGVVGVVLLVVGCMLTIIANARRTPPAPRPARQAGPVRTGRHGRVVTSRSPSVARLQEDVRRWVKSG